MKPRSPFHVFSAYRVAYRGCHPADLTGSPEVTSLFVRTVPSALTLTRWSERETPSPFCGGLDLSPPSADRFIIWVSPSITARYFSASPPDSDTEMLPHPASDTLPFGFPEPCDCRSALSVSAFRLRARIGFSIPQASPTGEVLPRLLDLSPLVRATGGLEPP
jgi:hypothetical protein